MRRFASTLLVLVAACSSSSNKHSGDASNTPDTSNHPDSSQPPDAFVPPDSSVLPDAFIPPDAPTNVTCLVNNMLGTVNPLMPTATADDATAPTMAEYDDALNADPLPDVIALQLYANYGVYANDTTVGPKAAVSLSGAESGYDTCGACLLIGADFDQNNGPAAVYMPTSGTLDITSTTTNLTGTLTNVTLVHVDIDPNTLATTPNADGCTTTIDSLAFDAPISTMFAPKKLRLHKKH